jgi:glutamate-5-semialdehyde dehydrogenase
VQLVATTDRAAVGHFLQLPEFIDLAIPRGGKSLIERVVAEATMPVIKHYDGVCHVYVHADADLDMAAGIIINSKCQKPGVCNALETILVHEDLAATFYPLIGQRLLEAQVEIHADPAALQHLGVPAIPATDADWSTEYLDLILAVKTVSGLDEAIAHINRYGSHHTDSIITKDRAAAERFQHEIDSAVVLHNASTRFNDGGEFGFGAEIGISTDKLHARGPMGLAELCSYKYLVDGSGQVRG